MTDNDIDPHASAAQMRLRAQPRPVLRLSRKALIAAGFVCCLGLVVVAGVALRSQTPKVVTANSAAPTAPNSRPSTEALSTLPKDYTDVPKLGPPLPGDLGRPMLAATEGSATGTSATGTSATGTSATGTSATGASATGAYAAGPMATRPAQDSAGQGAAHSAEARTAARNSQLFLPQQAMTRASSEPPTARPDPLAGLTALARPAPLEIKAEPARKRAFLEQVSDRQPVSDERLVGPASPYLLQAGSVVPAALMTGIKSDIPGQVLAQITEDITDSLTGTYLLIPRGSRLIGQYDNAIGFGQSRLLLTWSRLVLPNGKSILLDRMSAADPQGYAGLHDRTDHHWAGIVNAAALSTLLGMGAQTGDPADDAAWIRAMREGAADSINRAGQAIVERQLTIQPSLTARPGLPVRVIVSRDLVLEPYGD